jgi:hypothetical protein
MLVGCDLLAPAEPPRSAQSVDPDAAWKLVRQGLVKANVCFRDKMVYCITDKAFLDKHIQMELDRRFDGVMPTSKRFIPQVMTGARTTYEADQVRSGSKEVEAKVLAYFDDPKVTQNRAGVTVDLGILPGQFEEEGTKVRYVSDRVVEGEWKSEDAAAKLVLFAESHPDVAAVRLIVDIPQVGKAPRRMQVRLHRKLNRVLVYDAAQRNQAWASGPLGEDGLAPFVAGEKSLLTSALQNCTTEQYGAPPSQDCLTP